jgi:GTP diphosphokinase / guanosine-3',5'-bis(diphosphate) 3'-diphosphatase
VGHPAAIDTRALEADAEYQAQALCRLLETYLESAQVADVYRAYQFGARAHEGQTRLTGEPYITHPLAVARVLAEMHMDHRSIMAAILHDVIEDTPTAKDQLAREFGEEVAEMVDGVSKLSHIKFENKAEAQAENFRKMVLAMARDIRVMLVKLADRLHNMRTLGVMPPIKRRRIARETLEIFSPIANRLGINTMRVELEDLGFEALYPARARVIAESVKRARGNRKEIVAKIESTIKKRLGDEGLTGDVLGREKHLYSIYLKMRSKRVSFNDVMDVYAFRILVDSVDMCYRVLGAMHNLYKPVPGRFKDYIAIPKANGYQSLHTVLFGPHGVPIEIQIRTQDMHRVAESGIAAHWLYKSQDVRVGNGAQERAREWVKGLLEMQQNAGNSLEFIENVKIDLFPDAIYVFTPRGDIMELPKGATAVDFAYAVHTGVGNSCIAAKIDRRLAPLRTRLATGQTVEIVVAQGARPNPAWLNFVVTAKARSNIRHYLKNLRAEDAINLGRRMVDKALSSLGCTLDEIPQPQMAVALAELHVGSMDALCEEVGLGKRMPLLVARTLSRRHDETPESLSLSDRTEAAPLIIRGTEGMVVTFARCCRPIPGDPIAGFVSAGRGVVIHYQNCKNVAEYRRLPEKWIDVQWEEHIERDFPAEIRVDVTNQRGVLAKVAATIAEEGSDIENVNLEERDGLVTTLSFVLLVKDRVSLARIMKRLRVLPTVMKIARVRG